MKYKKQQDVCPAASHYLVPWFQIAKELTLRMGKQLTQNLINPPSFPQLLGQPPTLHFCESIKSPVHYSAGTQDDYCNSPTESNPPFYLFGEFLIVLKSLSIDFCKSICPALEGSSGCMDRRRTHPCTCIWPGRPSLGTLLENHT